MPRKFGRAPVLAASSRTVRVLCLVPVLFLAWITIRTSAGFSVKHIPVGRLTEEHVERNRGVGGSWYIPPSWLEQSPAKLRPRLLKADTILDAAEDALDLVLHLDAFLNNSQIPLIVHQTWRTLDTETWPSVIRESIEEWIYTAVGGDDGQEPPMAWFLWDDDGIDALIKKYEGDLYHDYRRLPYPVEKADVFRVVVLKCFGGVYADVDSKPLKHPHDWVFDSDLLPWKKASSHTEQSSHESTSQPHTSANDAPAPDHPILHPGTSDKNSTYVNAIFGIEADNPPDPDPTYWRMGYTYPVQLTNWALAMSPHHPVAEQFIATLTPEIRANSDTLLAIDPLDITGPPALTAAVRAVAERDDPLLSWDALSARNGDSRGGHGKVVAGDVLILPITGFSPGRGWFQNMGSQSVTHRNARLFHSAASSWRKADYKVRFGKLCRVALGMCKDWKKIP